jgi:hypothetical protein
MAKPRSFLAMKVTWNIGISRSYSRKSAAKKMAGPLHGGTIEPGQGNSRLAYIQNRTLSSLCIILTILLIKDQQ